MALTRWERKERLGHGALTQIALRCGMSRSHVSRVIAGQRADRKVEVVAARRLRLPVTEAFPEYYQPKPWETAQSGVR